VIFFCFGQKSPFFAELIEGGAELDFGHGWGKGPRIYYGPWRGLCQQRGIWTWA
jgi:hypothetical protein